MPSDWCFFLATFANQIGGPCVSLWFIAVEDDHGRFVERSNGNLFKWNLIFVVSGRDSRVFTHRETWVSPYSDFKHTCMLTANCKWEKYNNGCYRIVLEGGCTCTDILYGNIIYIIYVTAVNNFLSCDSLLRVYVLQYIFQHCSRVLRECTEFFF